MPVYTYEAVDSSGKKIKEIKEAPDIETLQEHLKKQGWIPLSIKPYTPLRFQLLNRLTQKDILVFTQELADLLEAGLPLDRAVLVLSQHTEKTLLREVLTEVYKDLQRGMSLSDALSKHRYFPVVYVNMIRAAEMGGILEPVLRRLASFLETTTRFKEEVISALVYPVLLSLVGSLAIVVLMVYVIPRFALIFEDVGQGLPLPTLILLSASRVFAEYWWVFPVCIFSAAFVLTKYLQTSAGRRTIYALLLRLPLIRSLQMKIYISRFTRTLGTLLKSGVPVLSAIRISREVIGNEIISERLKLVEDGVKKGRGITKPLKEAGVFPELMIQMIAVGEEAGRVEETLLQIAERYENDTRSMMKRLTGVFEPVIILIMGVIVGFIVLSMLLAIFSINEIPI